MSFRIERRGESLLVRIDRTACSEQYVVEAVNACRGRSWWSCPSGECAKIGSCDASEDGDTTLLALTPRPGGELSVSGMEECLRYVLDEALGAAPASGQPPR